ncbi:MAG: hypothetical protein M1338_04680 [Patescibacteria group bacterium]|nr:hypothetical protein [Patescibacteria group bacterium]
MKEEKHSMPVMNPEVRPLFPEDQQEIGESFVIKEKTPETRVIPESVWEQKCANCHRLIAKIKKGIGQKGFNDQARNVEFLLSRHSVCTRARSGDCMRRVELDHFLRTLKHKLVLLCSGNFSGQIGRIFAVEIREGRESRKIMFQVQIEQRVDGEVKTLGILILAEDVKFLKGVQHATRN